ncbi:oxidoreductase [Pararhizobium mangrovi]|uniref:SDR family NAD(P)-dependent oxidoreductase n=1 Tax=Pararhizobium mangrovi TaxID=2590452 RepID=A0A506UFT8_9HYPH|nr:oxidoreductase [Pararhizobium mangrovi]TPW31994.1 SDR family NAD(P)-dependent oxidoreductase [Pararhizobium mangrovi]
MPLDADAVWLITGCSTGFGRELARLVIEGGYRAVVTARDAERVADLADIAPDRAVAVDLDVTKADQIDAAVETARERFGRIDVLVNNAGYGYQTSVEEAEDAAVRDQFEANVFGLFAITRAVLPTMRQQRFGRILNVTSVAGLVGFPGSGYYAASKHAVEGWSDSLRAEVAPLGIGVTCVEPGPFRTDWAGRSLSQTATAIDDYADTVGARLATTKKNSGSQPGDPVRAGQAMIALAGEDEPPRHVVFGAQGFGVVTDRLRARLEEIESRREMSLGTDYSGD